MSFSLCSSRCAAALLVAALACVSSPAQKPKATKPAAAAKPSAKPSAGGAAHGATTAGHTTTTANHGAMTTTANHGAMTTTANHGGMTTANRGGMTAGRGGMAGGRSMEAGGRPGGASHFGGGGRAPAGSHEMRTANGSMVRTRANGSRSDFHDERRGIDVHHGLNGSRRISVERGDHSRVFAEHGRRGYVQHPYMYHGREFGHRTYYEHGRYYDHYYHRYPYHGGYMDVYAPNRYYAPGFYGWAYNPWRAPVAYSWGWGGSPWYGYYGGYFAPYPVYSSASLWLTDYLIATSLQAAYAEQTANGQAAAADAAGGPPQLTPEVKQMVANEVQQQIALENAEAAQNAQSQDIDPASSGIARMLSDNQSHVFVAGSDLDLVDASGQECAISDGDVLQVSSVPPPDATSVGAVVLASKGGRECARSSNVTVAFSDLQDMQNHMRETLDAGMGELQSKQGSGGLPPAPASAQAAPVAAAFTAGAPPPDTNAGAEITEQTQAADQAEQEVSSAAPAPGGPADAGAAPPPPAAAPSTIALGQSIGQVTASMGAPSHIIDLGTKKIYVYKDMKITFKSGKVSDVE